MSTKLFFPGSICGSHRFFCCHSMGHWLKHTNLIGPAPRSGPLAAIASICSNGTFQWGSARPDGSKFRRKNTAAVMRNSPSMCTYTALAVPPAFRSEERRVGGEGRCGEGGGGNVEAKRGRYV